MQQMCLCKTRSERWGMCGGDEGKLVGGIAEVSQVISIVISNQEGGRATREGKDLPRGNTEAMQENEQVK